MRRAPQFGASKKGKNVARLLKQVESLREEYAREKHRLDDALILHAAQVRPREERVTALRTEVVRALAPFLDRRMPKADARVLGVILREQLDEILAHVTAPAPDIAALFERLHGIGLDRAMREDLDSVRAEMAEAFEAFGLDMEVPDLRPDMTEEEMAGLAAQMAERMRQQYEGAAAAPAGQRRTKRQVQEEERAARREQARKISIGAVYKRLVKALHPDLEPDPAVRERKMAVMQAVTAAYAEQDMHTLLRLEIECLDGDGAIAQSRTDETLSAYAEVLREQVARLRAEIEDLPCQPRYADIVTGDAFGIYILDVQGEAQRLEGAIGALTAGIQRLSDQHLAVREVRDLIREHRDVRGVGRVSTRGRQQARKVRAARR